MPYRAKSVLLVAKRSKKSSKMLALLHQHFADIRCIEAVDKLNVLPLNGSYDLIVMMDDLGASMAAKLRQWNSSAKMIFLCDNVSEKTEIAMRSIGLVFLGSHNSFRRNCKAVFDSALRLPRGQTALPDGNIGSQAP